MENDNYLDICNMDDVECNIQSDSSNCWKNEKCKPLKSIKCFISQKLINKFIDIETCVVSKFGQALEFGLYLKGSFDSNGNFKIHNDIYIPKQIVSQAAIDFQDSVPEGFNGVVHRHPTGCSKFSGVDDQYINSNFEFSILFESGKIRQGIINLKIKTPTEMTVQLPLDVCIDNPKVLPNIDISMISKNQPVYLQPQKVPVSFETDSDFEKFHTRQLPSTFKEELDIMF